MLILSQFINGLQVGSIYALVALGYSMVYGIIMLLNFAHGDVIMIGGYIALLDHCCRRTPGSGRTADDRRLCGAVGRH